MAEKYDYDLFVIGAGSGGVRAGRVAASLGARVAIAEERYLGGTCVNVGCIPKKLLVYASEFSESFEDSAGFGWTLGERRFDWNQLIANKNVEIARLNGIYENLLINSGVKILRSRARIIDPHTIECGGDRFTTRYILIATGGWPTVPRIPGAELAITSNEAFFLDRMPERVVIVGGGYIGLEFAGIFHGLGAQVTVVHRGKIFLRGFDDDVRFALAAEMRKRGIDLRFETLISRIDPADMNLHRSEARLGETDRASVSAAVDQSETGGATHGMQFDRIGSSGGVHVTLSQGEPVDASLILFATGRAPNAAGIGLEDVGVMLDGIGAIVVDRYSRTSTNNIYAIGDVTNRRNLTPVAIAEGRAVAQTLFGKTAMSVDYDNVPSAVFSQPPIATVGLTEAEARERFGEIDIYRSAFRPLKHTLAGREERSLMKLIVDRRTERVVGCHMIGTDAGEIIQGFAVALQCGATKAQFDATIAIHPTAAEEFVTMREKAPA
jgi:glutathione reductase (NADPH)